MDLVLKSNVYNSLYSTGQGQQWMIPMYTCNTGNCTFDPFVTLAAEARCSDLTSLLQTDCQPSDFGTANCTVSIGHNGTSLRYYPGQGGTSLIVNRTTTLAASHESAPSRTSYPLPIVQYIMVKDYDRVLSSHDFSMTSRDTQFVAAECAIAIGVQAVHDSVKNGDYRSEKIGFWHHGDPVSRNLTSDAASLMWWEDLSGNFVLDESGTSGYHLPLGYFVLWETVQSLNSLMTQMFVGDYTIFGDFASWNGTQPAVDVLQSIFYGNFSGCGEKDDHLICGMHNMAQALTKTFRDAAFTAHGVESTNATVGQALVVRNFVRIDWVWLLLPVSLWLMATGLWIVTLVKTRRAGIPIWTNSILPFLFLYREGEDKEVAMSSGTRQQDYLRMSRLIEAQLRTSEGKAALL